MISRINCSGILGEKSITIDLDKYIVTLPEDKVITVCYIIDSLKSILFTPIHEISHYIDKLLAGCDESTVPSINLEFIGKNNSKFMYSVVFDPTNRKIYSESISRENAAGSYICHEDEKNLIFYPGKVFYAMIPGMISGNKELSDVREELLNTFSIPSLSSQVFYVKGKIYMTSAIEYIHNQPFYKEVLNKYESILSTLFEDVGFESGLLYFKDTVNDKLLEVQSSTFFGSGFRNLSGYLLQLLVAAKNNGTIIYPYLTTGMHPKLSEHILRTFSKKLRIITSDYINIFNKSILEEEL